MDLFAEQKTAIELNVNQINKYRSISGYDGMTHTKHVVVHGAPGTGKSFVGQFVVLHAITQALNVISTALMGVRANALLEEYICTHYLRFQLMAGHRLLEQNWQLKSYSKI